MLSFSVRISFARFVRVMIAVVALLSLVSPALAQQTTGTLQGVLTDQDGLEVPGAEVTLSSPSMIGGTQTVITDDTGTYQFVQLFPGAYTLRVIHPKFQGVSIPGIQVLINRTVVQNVTLQAGTETEIVVEATTSVVDTESTTIGTVLTNDFLKRIPVGRSYQEAVQVTAGVSGGANPNMAGGASDENSYLLDGAVVTDPVTGTFGNNFNFDAIQQIEVLLGGYDAEYGVSLGGIINIVTDSGTNNLEFDTSIYYINGNWSPRTDERLASDGVYLAPTGFDSQFQNMQVAANVSGPLVQDKAWFIFSYQWSRSLIALAGIPQQRDFDGHYILAKLTVQPSTAHRITAQIQADPTAIDNIYQNDQFILPEAQGRQYQTGFVSQLRWQWFFNSDMNLDTRAVVQKTAIEQSSVPCTHNRQADRHPCFPDEVENEIDYETPGRLGIGGAYDSVANGQYYFDNRWRFSAAMKYAWVGLKDPAGGSHDLKVGVETNQLLQEQTQGYSGNLLPVDVNRNGFDPETFTNYYWLETSGPITVSNAGSVWSAFIQDVYKPVPRVTIRYGVRYDNVVLRNDLGLPVVDGEAFSPRIFAAWDPLGDQKSKITGGWGRFTEQGRQEAASFLSRASFGSKLFLGEFFEAGDGTPTFGYTNQYSSLYDITPRENLNSRADGLALPYSDEFSIQVQRQIIEDLAFTARFQTRLTRGLYTFDEQNFIYDEDGSGIIGGRRGDPFNNYYRLRTPRESLRNYYRVDAELTKRFTRRWGGQITYSYTHLDGTSGGSFGGSFANDPQFQYANGLQLNATSAHTLRGYGAWDIPNDPWTTTLGFSLLYDSGLALERLYWTDAYARNPTTNQGFGDYSLRIRPRGYYTYSNPNWEVGFRLLQAFDVKKGSLVLDLFLQNAFNNQAPAAISAQFYQSNRLVALSRQDPMRIQIGLRYER